MIKNRAVLAAAVVCLRSSGCMEVCLSVFSYTSASGGGKLKLSLSKSFKNAENSQKCNPWGTSPDKNVWRNSWGIRRCQKFFSGTSRTEEIDEIPGAPKNASERVNTPCTSND
jgi:hypothetical protein